MNKNISIVVPVYNAEHTISKCIDSILRNGCSDCEIILINDGSSDNSWAILEKYREKYPDKIRIFNQENQGVAKTRNKGIEYSGSKYLMFIDCDDYIDNDYVEKFVKEIETKNLDVVIGGYRRVTDQKTMYEMRLKQADWSKYMTMAPWSKIYRKDFLTENNIEFLDNNIGEDVYFNLQAISLTNKISIIDYCGYNWFYNDQSVSNTKQKTAKGKINVIYLLDSCYNKLKEMGVIEKEEVEFYFIRYAVWHILFIGRNSKFEQLYSEFVKTFDWLKKSFPTFYINKNISPIHPEGETLRNRLAVYFFMLMYKFKLIRIFLKVYSI